MVISNHEGVYVVRKALIFHSRPVVEPYNEIRVWSFYLPTTQSWLLRNLKRTNYLYSLFLMIHHSNIIEQLKYLKH